MDCLYKKGAFNDEMVMGSFITRKMFRKTYISYPLIRTRTYDSYCKGREEAPTLEKNV